MTAMQPEPIAGGTSILKKLLAVMQDCGYIQKDKKNAFHNYSYASEAAIKDRVHAALVEHGVIPQISLLGLTEREIPKQGKASDWLTTANVHYKFYCCDTGEFIEGTFYGCGVDPSDKGLYKAITGAIKYLLTSQFLIPTGDDPENDDGRTASKEEKQGRQQEYLRSKGIGIDVGVGAQPAERTKPAQGSLAAVAVKSPSNTPDVRAASEQHKALILETAKMLDLMEIRHASQVAEADEALKEVAKPPAKKKGHISFEALKSWKKLKDELRELTGTDTIYYTTLKAKGFEHANQIDTEKDARQIFGVLGVERNRLKQEKELMGTLEHANEVLGARVFSDLLGAYGAERITDVFALTGDSLGGLLKAIKDCVDAKNGGKTA